MIIYQSTKSDFLQNILSNRIERIIQNTLLLKTGKHVAASEVSSWQNSLRFMGSVLNDSEIPTDSSVSIEYHIPQTSKRIDFILSGKNEDGVDHAVLIELKQWSEARPTKKDGVVITRFKGGEQETSHPSYQAWSYAALMEGFNETVYEEGIKLKPCAYLHNFVDDNIVTDPFYGHYVEKAPVFLAGEEEQIKLRDFIKKYVKHGDSSNIMYRIDNGRIRPSKALADSLVKMLSGNQEFVLIDDQKLVYETAKSLIYASKDNDKNVLIVEGGPGTGKTVVAINLLVEATHKGLLAQYVTKNAAPRAVYESKLTGMLRKSEFSNLFTGSGSFTGSQNNDFDVLIVDEAHRLNEKSGMFKHLGENQIKEIISTAKCSIFFIDEDQQVTWGDIGTKDELIRWAEKLGATVTVKQLSSQFRCNGSDGYLAWLDDILQIHDTANEVLDKESYDFQVIDSPHSLRALIEEKNTVNNKARLVAGYCWNWVSKNDSNAVDVIIPEHDFAMKWNLSSDGNLWIIAENGVNEIGCIHTCQGLELDYVGVIIGDDLVVRDGEVITNPKKRARTDKSLSGYGKFLELNAKAAEEKADKLIKNTYRTLLTRGMKGCYIFCTDPETQVYFKQRLGLEVAIKKVQGFEGMEEEPDLEFI